MQSLMFDPTNERTAMECWDRITRQPDDWNSTPQTKSQGQAWFAELEADAHLVYIDEHGLVMVQEFHDPALSSFETLASGRLLWRTVHDLLTAVSIAEGQSSI